jgi:multiple sugar transport system substrate-binding protein
MKFRLLVLIVLFSLVLTACGAPTAAPTQPPAADKPTEAAAAAATKAPEPTQPPAEVKPAGKVSIRVWAHQNNSFNAATQQMIDAFMKENPDIEVKLETFPFDVFIQTIQTSLPAGNTADVIQMPAGFTCRYALGGQLMSVPQDMMTVEQAKGIFFDAPLGGYLCDGKLYGLPVEYNLEYGGAYTNPALFQEAGLAYPPAWKTWDDVVADAEKLTKVGSDGVMTVAGMHYTNNDQLFTYFLSGILEQGGSYLQDDGRHFNFNTPEATAAIQKFADMAIKNKIVDPVIFNADSEWVGDSFAQGHNAIGVLGSWYAGEAALAYPDLKFDYVTLPPMFGDQHKFVSASGWGLTVSQSTPNAGAAWKLVNYMATNKDNGLLFATTTGTIPALKSVADEPALVEKAPFLKTVLPLLPNGQYYGDLTDAGQLEFEIIYPNILDVLQGIQTAPEAAQNIDTQANAMVDAAK